MENIFAGEFVMSRYYYLDTCILDIAIDEKLITRAQKKLESKAVQTAMNQAAKRAVTHLMDEVAYATSQDYYLKKNFIKNFLAPRVDNNNNGVSLRLLASSKKLPLSRYEISPRKRPNTRMHGLYAGVMRKGGMKLIPRGFLLRDNQPWIRESGTEKWKVIKPLRGPSIASIARNPDNLSDVMEKTKETFAKRFQHEVLYRLGVFKK